MYTTLSSLVSFSGLKSLRLRRFRLRRRAGEVRRIGGKRGGPVLLRADSAFCRGSHFDATPSTSITEKRSDQVFVRAAFDAFSQGEPRMRSTERRSRSRRSI